MSWSCSLALVEEFKRQGCLVTASYARLKEIRSAEKSSWLDRKTGQSRPSQSGTTPEPLTVSLGVAPLMSSVVGSRVSPSAKQGNKKQSKTTETSGPIQSESFARYDQESSSWRTSPDLFGSTSLVSWETWPKQGTMQNGACWERETSELHTSASGSGSWLATPTAQPYGSNSGGQNSGLKRHSLQSMAKNNLWPTPQARDYKGVPGNNFNMSSLPRAVNQWPTPTARDHKDGTKESCQNVPVNCLLGRAVHVDSTSTTGSLNPLWVEWLMGWPIGWTGLEPLGTGKSHSATPQPGDC
jgi:hypothetical protein